MGSGRYRFLTSGLLLAIAPTISGYCYLLDANAKCGLCWETTYGDAGDTTGVTIMKECPVGIVETWTKPPPTQMSSMQFYDVGYSLQLDTTMRSQVSQGLHQIPHANIHSCIASRGACTPFVANSPGLATHSAALVGNFTSAGLVTFESQVQLPESQYTIIAHVRFYARPRSAGLPNTKWDVAIGVSRNVVPSVPACLYGQSESKNGALGETLCEACPSGYFNDDPSKECRPCAAGAFSFHSPGAEQGASECIKCRDMPGTFYQPQAGQAKCLECPPNTDNSGSKGLSQVDCICRPGFWRPDGQIGTECYECPVGAECQGGVQSTQPFTRDGFWAPTHTNGTIDGFPFAVTTVPQIFFRCPNAGACKANNTCDELYDNDSKMCMQCNIGLHKILSWCQGCPGGAFLTVLEWTIVVLLWQSVRYLSKVYPALDLLLLYAQCLSIIQGFNVPWPKRLYELTMVMSIVNFNIDAVTPSCAGFSWNFYKSFYFTILLPVMFGLGHLAWVGVGYAWMKSGGGRTAFGGNIVLSCFVTNAKEFQVYWMTSFSNWIALLGILYNVLCVTLLQTFMCFEMPNGTQVLRIDPDQICGDADHHTMMVFACLGIVVYVFGIPFALFRSLSQKRNKNQLKDEESLIILGFLYTHYEPGFWFWEIIITTRRFILCMLMVLFYDAPRFQLACGLILAIVCICTQYFFRPFKYVMLDVLDAAALVSMALYMIAGLIFTSEGSSTEEFELTTWFIFVSTISFIFFALFMFTLNIVKNRHGWRNQELIRDHTVGAWVKATAALRLKVPSNIAFYALIGGEGQASVPVHKLTNCAAAVGLDTVLGKDVIGHLLFLLLDRNRSGTVPSEEALENLYLGFDINTPAEVKLFNEEINNKYFRGAFPADYDAHTLNVSIPVSMDSGNTTTGRHSGVAFPIQARGLKPQWLQEMFRREMHVQDKGFALNQLLSEGKLGSWLQSLLKEKDLAMIMVVSLVNQWLSPFFTESAEFGLNAYTEECKFYQDMGFGCPFLLDMLLSATDEQQAKCKVDIKQWFFFNQAQQKAHSGVVLSDEIDFFLRPQLLHWLVNHSDDAQRKIFQKMMFNIVEHHEKESKSFFGTTQHKVHPLYVARESSAESVGEMIESGAQHVYTHTDVLSFSLLQGGGVETEEDSPPLSIQRY